MSDVRAVRCDFCETVAIAPNLEGWIFIEGVKKRPKKGTKANARVIVTQRDYCAWECMIADLEQTPKERR